MLLTTLWASLVYAGEPECARSDCQWQPDNYMFGDARYVMGQGGSYSMKHGGAYNFLQPSLCSAENWRVYTQCIERCPLAIVITEPANLSVRACIQPSDFNPYAPNQHIDLAHPLNNKELEFINMYAEGRGHVKEREACELPPDADRSAYAGKIILSKRGGCYFSTKGQTTAELGGLFGLVVDASSSTRAWFGGLVMGGRSSGFENTPTAMMQPHVGDILMDALDAGITVKGHVSLDCSVMTAPPPPVGEVPENCPSTSLFGMCDDRASEEEQLCSRCSVQTEFQDGAENKTGCLYNHELVPATTKNSLVTLGGPDVNVEVHLAELVPGFMPDPDCTDRNQSLPGGTDPFSGQGCDDIADLIRAKTISSCAYLLQEGFSRASTPWFMENCRVTCPRSVGGVGCNGGTGEGCDVFDFVNMKDKVVAVGYGRTSGCNSYQLARKASEAGVAGLIVLTDLDNADGTPVPEFIGGPSKFVDMPVHSLDYDTSVALHRAIKNRNAQNAAITSITVTITQKPPAPSVARTPLPTDPGLSLAGLEGSSDFQWTDSVIISVVFGFLLCFINIAVFVNQRINSIELPRQSTKNASGMKIPLSAASMGLSLSLLMCIAVVAFSLAYKAGKDTTDSALDDGWAAVEKTHANAVSTVEQLKDQLLGTIVGRVGQGISSGLNAGNLAAQQAAKIFLIADGTWEDFDKRIWLLNEFSKGGGQWSPSTNWKLAVRTKRGFYASSYLKTDDRPNSSRDDGTLPLSEAYDRGLEVGNLDGLPHVSVSQDGTLYGTNYQTYRAGDNINREFCTRNDCFNPSKSLGRVWMDAVAKMEALHLPERERPRRGQVFCYTPLQTIPVQQYVSFEYGLRPLSCLTPIYNANNDFLGAAQAHIEIEDLGTLVGLAARSEQTQNMTILVFNERSELVTSSKGRSSRIIDNYGGSYYQFVVSALNYGDGTFTDRITQPIVLEYAAEPFINSAANYMKNGLGLGVAGDELGFNFDALRSSGENGRAGLFDQATWYGGNTFARARRWTQHVTAAFNFDADDTTDSSGEAWVADVAGIGSTWVPGARTPTSKALHLNGSGYLQMNPYLYPTTPRVAKGDNEAYNNRLDTNIGQIVAFATHDEYWGKTNEPLLREPLIASTFSLAMWIKPDVAISDDPLSTSPKLFSDTRVSFKWKMRLYANGKMVLTEWADTGAWGCQTKPIPGGPRVNEWTHITVVVDRDYRGIDAELSQKPVDQVQTCKVYVNGILHDMDTIGGGLVYYDTMLPNVEPYYFGQSFKGALDEVTFFNATLSSQDIASVMASGPLEYTKHVPSKEWYLQVKSEAHYNMTWGVAGLIPRADIMRTVDLLNALQRQNQTILRENTNNKLDQNLAEVMLIIVCIALASIAVFLIFNEILTRPFAMFARQMTDVAVMKVEDVEMETQSILREIDSMHNAMTLMVRNLKEYKSYMPQTMLMMNEDEEEEDIEASSTLDATATSKQLSGVQSPGLSRKDSVTRGSTRSSFTGRSSMQQSVVSTNLAKARKQEASVKVGTLQGKRCSFISCNVENFLAKQMDRSKVVPTHTKLLEVMLQSCSLAKGVPDTFCGDRLFCSFNAVKQISGFRSAAVTAAHMSRSKIEQDETTADFPVSFAVVTGECSVGNMGTATMRRFSFHSTVVPWCVALERHQRALGCTGVIDSVTKEDAATRFVLRIVDAPIFPKRKAEPQRVFEVIQARASADEEEWMYQLEKQKANDPHAVWNNAVESIIKGELKDKAEFAEAVQSYQTAGGSAQVIKVMQTHVDAGIFEPTEVKWH